MLIYTVRAGDNIYALAAQFGTTAEAIARDNQLEFPNRLVVGQALVIEGGSNSYIVRSGDSLYSIAQAQGVPLRSLQRLNPQAAALYPGQVLRIPAALPGGGSGRTILVNGYCYPHIANDVLQSTLPFLSYASVFSYEARADGSLSALGDQRVLGRITAGGAGPGGTGPGGTGPLMVITNIDESGSFSTALASSILRSDAAQDALTENIRDVLLQRGYRGLDVDFEYVDGADRERYNTLLRRLKEMLAPLGLPLSTAVAAKTRSNQPGILYEGADYAAHGQIVDHVLLMTYDWGYRYGPPMAVSPYHRVEEVVQYAITQIPRHKILLGMPNYGYDWALPYAQGEPATLVRNTEAVSLAASTWSEIHFDAVSRTPYFNYRDARGREHVVWFDDARSFEAKLSLVAQYGLGGIGYWNINTLFLQGWLVLGAMYGVTKVI